MKKKNYETSIIANVSAHEAMHGISRVQDWWAKNFQGSAKNLNDTFRVTFGETFVNFTISEMIPDTLVVWTVTDCYLHWLNDKKEWNNTKVLWKISEEGDKANIHFTHLGLQPQIECYNDCIKGWDGYIKGSLLNLLNRKVGQPG